MTDETYDHSELAEYLENEDNIKEVSYNEETSFVSVKLGIAGMIGRKQTQKARDMGYVVGDIKTILQGNKHNPSRVLKVWFRVEERAID